MGWQADREIADRTAVMAEGVGTWLRHDCPFCEFREGTPDKKQSWGFDLRTLRHHCFRCGNWGYLTEAPDAFDHIDLNAEDEKPVEEIKPPMGFMRAAQEPARSSISAQPAIRYLLSRGVTKQIAIESQVGLTLEGFYANRIIVPLLNGDKWDGWVGRVWKTHRNVVTYRYPKGMKRGETMFNLAALAVETDDPLLVVEGCFDALPHWPHAVSCLGKPTDWQFEQLLKARRPIVVALDGDAWTEGWGLATRLAMEGKQATSLHLPPVSDPGDMKSGELMTQARNALSEVAHGLRN